MRPAGPVGWSPPRVHPAGGRPVPGPQSGRKPRWPATQLWNQQEMRAVRRVRAEPPVGETAFDYLEPADMSAYDGAFDRAARNSYSAGRNLRVGESVVTARQVAGIDMTGEQFPKARSHAGSQQAGASRTCASSTPTSRTCRWKPARSIPGPYGGQRSAPASRAKEPFQEPTQAILRRHQPTPSH